MILLDTHLVVWAAENSSRLSRKAASEIRRNRRSDGLAASAISIWELAWLLSKGRVNGHGTIEDTIKLLLENIAI